MNIPLSPLETGRVQLYRALRQPHLPIEERIRSYRSAHEQLAQSPVQYAFQEGTRAFVPASLGFMIGTPMATQLVTGVARKAMEKAEGLQNDALAEMGRIPDINRYVNKNIAARALEAARNPELGNEVYNKAVQALRTIDPRVRHLASQEIADQLMQTVQKHGKTYGFIGKVVRPIASFNRLSVLKRLGLMLAPAALIGAGAGIGAVSRLSKGIERDPEEIAQELAQHEVNRALAYGRRSPTELILPALLQSTQTSEQ